MDCGISQDLHDYMAACTYTDRLMQDGKDSPFAHLVSFPMNVMECRISDSVQSNFCLQLKFF
jgi:hypothetical protein